MRRGDGVTADGVWALTEGDGTTWARRAADAAGGVHDPEVRVSISVERNARLCVSTETRGKISPWFLIEGIGKSLKNKCQGSAETPQNARELFSFYDKMGGFFQK